MDIDEETSEEYRTKEAYEHLMGKPLLKKTMGKDFEHFFEVEQEIALGHALDGKI